MRDVKPTPIITDKPHRTEWGSCAQLSGIPCDLPCSAHELKTFSLNTRRNVKPAPIIIKPHRTSWGSCAQLPGAPCDLPCSAHDVRTARSQCHTGGLLTAQNIFSAGLKSAREALKSARQFVDATIEDAKIALQRSIQHALSTARYAKNGLIDLHDLPLQWHNNPYILRGYRFCATQKECVSSLWTFNNETMNILTHAGGLVLILAVAFYVFPNSAHFSLLGTADVFFYGLFFAAACKCMLCSCTFHTMHCIADLEMKNLFCCVDYTGISFLIAASLMSIENMAFYCNPTMWWISICTTGMLGIIGTALPWHPYFNGNDKSWLRVLFFMGMVASGIIPPLLTLTYLHGLAYVYNFYTVLFWSLFTYAAGATLYATRQPEKFFPKAFDYIGSSHNIWHVAVVAGVVLHYYAITHMFMVSLDVASPECRMG